MLNRFVKDAREIAADAEGIARRLSSSTIEAEHLLLALAERPRTTAYEALSAAGLEQEALREALDDEYERSLAAVGVSLAAFDLAPVAHATSKPRWAASAKLALERSLKVAAGREDRRIEPAHILLGVLGAPLGTVPRALDGAGIDRIELSRRVEAALDRAA